MENNPALIIGGELLREVLDRAPYPPGPTTPSVGRTLAASRYPLPLLLSLYQQHGPIFTFRALHRREIFMLGPAANHFITVEHPELFHWRDGHFGELTPLVGDGLITTDGGYHDRARRLVMPAFHRRHVDAAAAVMSDETDRSVQPWATAGSVDVYAWARRLTLRVAMRALLGLDPDDADLGAVAATQFERALAFYGTDAPVRVLRGPWSPWSRMTSARSALDEIVYGEITRRRAAPDADRQDVLSLLIGSEGEAGERFSDEEIRDHVVTFLFAGHDTSSSALAMLLYELARHPDELAAIRRELEDDAEGLPRLGLALDESLRLHPPVWIGARRAMRGFEFAGCQVPAGAFVNYSSWASHRLPDVFEDPDAFVPERFTPERRAALPRGAYLPFGAGSRICIGKRFALTQVKLIASLVLRDFAFELPADYSLRLSFQPTLAPKGGLPMHVRRH